MAMALNDKIKEPRALDQGKNFFLVSLFGSP